MDDKNSFHFILGPVRNMVNAMAFLGVHVAQPRSGILRALYIWTTTTKIVQDKMERTEDTEDLNNGTKNKMT